jgi:hypothetical protein
MTLTVSLRALTLAVRMRTADHSVLVFANLFGFCLVSIALVVYIVPEWPLEANCRLTGLNVTSIPCLQAVNCQCIGCTSKTCKVAVETNETGTCCRYACTWRKAALVEACAATRGTCDNMVIRYTMDGDPGVWSRFCSVNDHCNAQYRKRLHNVERGSRFTCYRTVSKADLRLDRPPQRVLAWLMACWGVLTILTFNGLTYYLHTSRRHE